MEVSNVINEKTRGFLPNAQGSNQENLRQDKVNIGRKYCYYNREGHFVSDGNYNRKKNFNQGNYCKRNDRSGLHVPPQKLVAPRDGGVSMARVENIL